MNLTWSKISEDTFSRNVAHLLYECLDLLYQLTVGLGMTVLSVNSGVRYDVLSVDIGLGMMVLSVDSGIRYDSHIS